jgi:hypothetical protein
MRKHRRDFQNLSAPTRGIHDQSGPRFLRRARHFWSRHCSGGPTKQLIFQAPRPFPQTTMRIESGKLLERHSRTLEDVAPICKGLVVEAARVIKESISLIVKPLQWPRVLGVRPPTMAGWLGRHDRSTANLSRNGVQGKLECSNYCGIDRRHSGADYLDREPHRPTAYDRPTA